jgi:Nucleotidyl transferase AbiEii toxin, Type IV TA system
VTQKQFYDWQTAGGGGDVSLLVATLERREIPWCMIGGLAVNHWAKEPMTTADVDVVIAAERIAEAVKALQAVGFKAKKFKWSVNLKGRSKVLVQISTEEVYREFPERSVPADIHGILMRVASLKDTLRGKILAWQDPERRASKRQKDLLDIMRLVEAHSNLRKLLPADLAKKIKE